MHRCESDPVEPKMAELEVPIKIQFLKLKRINELNKRLREEIKRERITASNSCLSIIDYSTSHRDYTLPGIWGHPPPGSNPFRGSTRGSQRKYAGHQSESSTCCVLM
ncbi:LAMI_0H03686g1_1 [Lachancea mirantina]|uniref:Guanine nucleotide-binding protein subunit gamma n=1 Tax=Lachancea mirantina TaxID=1230905 RepID=A0A1G4KEI1_9SACH|nr:LAMI_0H03686g1_1 [Lachancea mirantina]